MEPRSRPVLWDEPELEEPIEVIDYYEAMQMGWLSLGVIEDVEPDSGVPGSPGE
ncbi:MAG: hypothetical protein ACREJ8_10485 [Candidatus Methylomirabilales bacterium]